jgi:hypothetical protein
MLLLLLSPLIFLYPGFLRADYYCFSTPRFYLLIKRPAGIPTAAAAAGFDDCNAADNCADICTADETDEATKFSCSQIVGDDDITRSGTNYLPIIKSTYHPLLVEIECKTSVHRLIIC